MMEANESWERVDQGLRRAASCCRELAVLNKAHEWNEVSRQLLLMMEKCQRMYQGVPLNEVQVMHLCAEMEQAQRIAQAMSQTRH